MKQQRRFGRIGWACSLALSAGLVVAACSNDDCSSTGSCGEFTPPLGCGWLLEDGQWVTSIDELRELGATCTGSRSCRLEDGSIPEFLCELPDGGYSGAPGQAGSGNGGSSSGGGRLCGETPVNGCRPAEDATVFVDAGAQAGGNGSKAAPFNSVATALGMLDGATHIILCNTTYDEKLVLGSQAAGVTLSGGFDCDSWRYAANGVTKLQPSTPGIVLEVAAADGLVLEDITIQAQSARAPGESSIAAFVASSDNVVLRRMTLIAGSGVDGQSGTLTPYEEGNAPGDWPLATALSGNSGTATKGGAVKGPIMCPAGDNSFGGEGGDNLPENGNAGGPAPRGGVGGSVANSCNSGGGGADGTSVDANGADGIAVSTRGTLGAEGWVPAHGNDGEPGKAGGGGGGGAGASTGGGGGGGAGGCGGAAGTGGKAGGSSIALLSWNSTLELKASKLTSAVAGKGGKGVAGQAGQVGGSAGVQQPDGCSGGKGAQGGRGGAGAGGAGGISVGIAWKGTSAPSVDASTQIMSGSFGVEGNGAGASNDGVPGVAQAIFPVDG